MTASSAPANARTLRLELERVSMSFGNTRALRDVSFALRAGEVHVLAGENGAGKSTLIRIVSGVYRGFLGTLRLDGRPVRFPDPASAVAAGVTTIHQELSLVPPLSTTDNFLLAAAGGAFRPLRRGAARAAALAALSRLGVTIDPDVPVERLALAERQLVEIARALSRQARVLVMDEPTSALSEPEVQRLFGVVERLRAEGTSILYISHRLPEIARLADRITVLRDGASVLSAPAAELSEGELVAALLGDKPRRPPAQRTVSTTGVKLRVRNLRTATRPRLHGIDFELVSGEILGIAGVQGSGAAQILHALFGDVDGVEGDIELDGRAYVPETPRVAFRRRLALVASDRALGVLKALSVRENGTLSSLERFSRHGFVAVAREHDAVRSRAEQVHLKAPSLAARAETLSGGNQQKLALMRCLLAEPRVLLLDDPTRGIDLGAKSDVYELLQTLATDGTGIVVYSSELDELTTLCDRVLVVVEGRAVRTLGKSELERDRLLSLVMGSAA